MLDTEIVNRKLGGLIITINRPKSPNRKSRHAGNPSPAFCPPPNRPNSPNHQSLIPNCPRSQFIGNQLGSAATPFMQNKPNPKNTKTSSTYLLTKTYKTKQPHPTQKNKPKTNPIRNTPSAARYLLHNPRPPSLTPKSAQPQAAAHQLCAKTERNHHLFMQNKPNPKNNKTNLNPYPKKHYARISSLQPRKNKPNSNPIQTQPNPISPPKSTKQTQSKPNLTFTTSSILPNFTHLGSPEYLEIIDNQPTILPARPSRHRCWCQDRPCSKVATSLNCLSSIRADCPDSTARSAVGREHTAVLHAQTPKGTTPPSP